MHTRIYKKLIYYLKSSGACVVVVGSCWFLYQLRLTSQILHSSVNANVLDLEHSHTEYIYIDNPRFKDAFIFRNHTDLHTLALGQTSWFTNYISEWYNSFHNKLAYRLLYIAQNSDENESLKAIESLNNLKHLKDWHYRQMAQMLDASTAVILARCPNVDLRFFLDPPNNHINYKLTDIIHKMHYFMQQLNILSNHTHTCLSLFLNKIFKDAHPDGLIFDPDLTNIGLTASPKVLHNEVLLQDCIRTVYHHTCIEEYSKDIFTAGGLLLLMDLHKYFKNNIEINILLAKILSNLSLNCEYLDEIFKSGWIGVLASWVKNPDIRLAAPAGRALANLDLHENKQKKYSRHVYLLHPLKKIRSSTKLDVIFLHGLLGGIFVTWRKRDPPTSVNKLPELQKTSYVLDLLTSIINEQPQEFLKDLTIDLYKQEWKKIGHDFEFVFNDCPENLNEVASELCTCSWDDDCVQEESSNILRTQCWPKDWLAKDAPLTRILGINYDTNLSRWKSLCPVENKKGTISERSNEYVKKLLMAGVGQQPVIWVCHSMGGLLVKKMLVEEWKNGDKFNLCKNTRAIIFYSTPHKGSRLAVLRQMTEMLISPSIEVQELREESPALLKLHDEFLKVLREYPMKIVSFSESKPTLVTALKFPLRFVTHESANPGIGEFYKISQDHLSICKPANKQSFLYQRLLKIIKQQIKIDKETTGDKNEKPNFFSFKKF